MNKLTTKITLVSSLMLLAGCVTPEPINDHKPAGCNANNVNIKVELDQSTSTPKLSEKAQRVVCIASGNTVSWQRSHATGSNDFTVYFKGSAVQIPAINGRATYTAPTVTSIDALSYGIMMPDAAHDLDPIIIIIPSFGEF